MAEGEETVVESRRDLLSEAWDKAMQTETTNEVPDEQLQTTTGADESVSTTGEDENTDAAATDGKNKKAAEGKSDSKSGKEAKGKEQKKLDPVTQERKAAAEEGKDKGKSADVGKPPVGWKPEVKELWSKLPAEVRSEVSARELQIQQELTRTAGIRKFAQELTQVIAPHAHIIRSRGATPLMAIKNLLDTASGLTNGSASQKAQIIADIIGGYGVDIKELDTILVKGMKGGQYQSPTTPRVEGPPEWAKPLFSFMDNVNRSRQSNEQRLQQDAEKEIQEFQEKPFFDDLRDTMGDLMEAAAKRNITMTMQEAYDRAIEVHPNIKKIVLQRRAAERNVSAAASTLAKSKKAASTVASAPVGRASGKIGGEKPQSRREQLSAAWDEAVDA